MSSLLMKPCLLPVLAEEHSGTGVKGSALSSGQQASGSYRPVLNNNSFLRPSSAKVPLLQSLEIKKVKNTHGSPTSQWPCSGGNGNSSPGSLVNTAVKNSNLVLEQTVVASLTPVPSSVVLGKDWCSQEDTERRAYSLKENEPKMSLTEAVQQQAGQTGACNGFAREVECSGLRTVGSLSNWNSNWGQRFIAQLTPKEAINGSSSLIGTDGAVVCTKRISVHLLASRAGSPDRNTDGRLVGGLSPCGGDPVARTDPPHLSVISEVATRMSTIQLEKEEKWAQAVLLGKLE